MKATDLLTHIDRLGMVVSHRGSVSSIFRLSNQSTLYLYDDESWVLKTRDIHDGTTDILDDEVFSAFEMSDQELLSQIEEEIMKGKLEVM